MFRMIAPTLVLLTAAALVSAQEADARIAKLCQSLGSEDAKERDEATKELITIGKPSIAPLKKLLDSTDAEVRARAEVALKEIADRLRREALTLIVTTDKKTYRPGEVVKIEARLRNAGEDPVVAPKFEWDGGLTANSWITVAFGGKGVRFAGDALPQVMVQSDVDEDRFMTIAPKAEPVVRSVEFSEYWDLGGKDPSLKESYHDAKTLPLKPGTYKARATYAFRIDKTSPRDEDFGKAFRFKGKARDLFDACWRGSLEAEVEFTVTDKD